MSPTPRHKDFLSHGAGRAVRAIVAGCVVFATPALAQQQASKPVPSKPPASKPAAGKAAVQAAVPPVPGEPMLLAQYDAWGAYTAMPNGKKVCFALAKPATTTTVPPNRPRDPAWMFISSRPGEKVRDEVSVVFGYGLKPNSDANIEVLGGSYAMTTQADGAWVKNPAEEPRLVETMRKGRDLTVKGTSARGTVSTDVYSLKGLAQALDKVGQECR